MPHIFGRIFGPSVPVLTGVVLLGFAFGLPTAGAASAVSPGDRTAEAQTFANEKLALWQQRLNLRDWNISIAVARATDLKPRTLGNIHWDTEKKTALIRVLDPTDYKLPPTEILKDIEFTVVHELVHLELAPLLTPLQRNEASRRDEEYTVDHITDALLKLDRSR